MQPGIAMIELVIYIAILGLLAVTVGPKFMQMFFSSQAKVTKLTLKGTVDAINAYQLHTGRYPDSLEDLNRRPSDERVAHRWEGPYLDNVKEGDLPRDGWNNELQYQRLERGYELYSLGKNGDAGSEEDRIFAETR